MICTHTYHVATKWLWGVLECAEQGSKKYCENCQYRVMYQWIIDLYSANLDIHSSLMNQISKRIELQPNCIVAPWIIDMHVSFFVFVLWSLTAFSLWLSDWGYIFHYRNIQLSINTAKRGNAQEYIVLILGAFSRPVMLKTDSN